MLIESELRELLGIPNEVLFGVMTPIGWPGDEFVKVKRKPIAKSFIGKNGAIPSSHGEPSQNNRNFAASVRRSGAGMD
jgi:hypothetical protein